MVIKKVLNWLPSRLMGRPPSTIVVHASAGASALSSINWLKKIGLSYHFIIDRDGTIYKCVPVGPPARVAYHAGKSIGPEGANVNGYSIGVCFANKNDGEPYTNEQEQAMIDLCRLIKQAYPTIKWLTTHRLIAPRRKTDPFNWKFLLAVAQSLNLTPWRPNENHSWI